jgi:hypothetical protein
MSALGHKRTLSDISGMSALPPKADIAERHSDVRFVPKTDMRPSGGANLAGLCSATNVANFTRLLQLIQGSGVHPKGSRRDHPESQ